MKAEIIALDIPTSQKTILQICLQKGWRANKYLSCQGEWGYSPLFSYNNGHPSPWDW